MNTGVASLSPYWKPVPLLQANEHRRWKSAPLLQAILDQFSSIFAGRHMIFFAEDPVHGTLAVKTGIHAGFGDGLIAQPKEMDEVTEPGLVQIVVEVHMESRGEEPGQGIGTDIEILCHGGQGHFACMIPGDIFYGPIDQVVASHGILLNQIEHRKNSSQNDLEIGIHQDIMVDLTVIEILQAEQGLNDVLCDSVLGDDRISGRVTLQGIPERGTVISR